MAMTLDGSNGVTFNDSSLQGAAASPFGLKNRIINGDMVIDQRNAGAAVSLSNANRYTLDRFSVDNATDGVISVQQSTVAPNNFINSMGVTVTTADASIGATQYSFIRQSIEGLNVADLGWGTANAQTITVSFWVRSSVTGTFGGSIQNSAENRAYAFTYTINSANTWEKETITIAGDTSGTWLTTNGVGLRLNFNLGTGTTYSSTANTWAAQTSFNATGSVALLNTLNATFYITGVQLERNTTATPFEWIPYGTELALCQRYYESSYNIGVAAATPSAAGQLLMVPVFNINSTAYTQVIYYKVSKRTTPTVTPYAYDGTSGKWHTGVIGSSEQLGNATIIDSSQHKFSMYIAYTVTPTGSYGHFTASAEL